MTLGHEPARATGNRESGFTLLEILVAMVVMGFLLIGLTQGTRFGLRAWQRQSATVAQTAELDAVDRALRRLIEEMEPGSPNGGPALAGNAARLAFLGALPMAAALPTSRADMVLTLDGGAGEAHRLVLRWTPHLHATRFGPPPAPAEAELLTGVARLEIGYWPRGGAGGWRSSWTDRDLPGLIRIRILFPDGDKRRWPDIVAAPMLGPQG